MSAFNCCVKLDGHRYHLQHLFFFCVYFVHSWHFSVLQEALWKWSRVHGENAQVRHKQMWWQTKTTQGHCGGEVRAAAHLAACRRPVQRWNNPHYLSQKFVQTTCSEHKRVEKSIFLLFLFRTGNTTTNKKLVWHWIEEGQQEGEGGDRLSAPKTKFTPNAGYDLKNNASKFFLYT